MKFNIVLNQPMMIKHNLNTTQWCVLDVISVAPTWCDAVSKDNEIYFWVARQKIASELEALDLKPDTIYRNLKKLVELGFLEYEKLGKKDLIRLSKKGKSIFFSMSDMNPNELGYESEKHSDMNPTDNNTNSITKLKDKSIVQKEQIESDFNFFWSNYPKKKDKEKAKKSFIKHYKELPEINDLVRIVIMNANTNDWKKEKGQYIPMPSTWLNGKRWQDDVAVEQTIDVNSLIADGHYDPFNPEHHALKEKYENQSQTQGYINE